MSSCITTVQNLTMPQGVPWLAKGLNFAQTAKCGVPCYTFQKSNIVIKEYCVCQSINPKAGLGIVCRISLVPELHEVANGPWRGSHRLAKIAISIFGSLLGHYQSQREQIWANASKLEWQEN